MEQVVAKTDFMFRLTSEEFITTVKKSCVPFINWWGQLSMWLLIKWLDWSGKSYYVIVLFITSRGIILLPVKTLSSSSVFRSVSLITVMSFAVWLAILTKYVLRKTSKTTYLHRACCSLPDNNLSCNDTRRFHLSLCSLMTSCHMNRYP